MTLERFAAWGAVAGEFQLRIRAGLIHALAVEIGQPGLDVAPGQDQGDAVVGPARLHFLSATGIVELLLPILQSRAVRIHHHDGEVLDVPCAVHAQQLGDLL